MSVQRGDAGIDAADVEADLNLAVGGRVLVQRHRTDGIHELTGRVRKTEVGVLEGNRSMVRLDLVDIGGGKGRGADGKAKGQDGYGGEGFKSGFHDMALGMRALIRESSTEVDWFNGNNRCYGSLLQEAR